MRCRSTRLSFGLALFALAIAGCDQSAIGPAPLPAYGTPTPTAVAPKATRVWLIMPRDEALEHGTWEKYAREEASAARALLEVKRPQSDGPPTGQADLVRGAAEGGASALIIVAEDPKSLAPALVEARAQGMPIVLLERDVPVEGKPFPLVLAPPFLESAKQSVEAALEDATSAGFPREGPAIILANNGGDTQTPERIEALQQALKEAGVRLLKVVRFGTILGQPTTTDARQAIEPVLAANPKLAMILATDDEALNGTVTLRDERFSAAMQKGYGGEEARRAFANKGQWVVAGYASATRNFNLARFHMCSAISDRNLIGMARQALQLALRQARGETVPGRTVVETKLYRG